MSRRRSPLSALVALFASSLVLGIVVMMLMSAVGDGGNLWLSLLLTAVTAAGVALAVWVSIVYWRRLDEAAREAHKWAWFWGGSGGLLAAVMVLSFLMSNPHVRAPLLPGQPATDALHVATGGMIVIMLLMVGYGLAWAGWWLWRGR